MVGHCHADRAADATPLLLCFKKFAGSQTPPSNDAHNGSDCCFDVERRGIHEVGIVALPEGSYAALGITRIPILQILQKGVHVSRHPQIGRAHV